MPTKRKVTQKQKQKQRQSVVVNVNVAKARGKSSAKKSGKKGGRGSVMMLPPPIYASPIDRLTPAMYGPQGQQIQQQSLDQMLKAFLSNQEKQKVGSFNTLGSIPGSSSVSYKPSFMDYHNYLESQRPRKKTPEELDIIKEKYRQDLKKKGITDIPTPFQNEERTYLKASEPDYDATSPQFSEKLKPENSIYETIRQMEDRLAKDEDLIKQSRKWVEDSYKNYPNKINKSPFDESPGSNQSLGSFPGMYGPRVPVNKSEQEGYFQQMQGGDAKKRISKILEDYEIYD